MTKDEAIRILKNTAWLGSEEDLEAIETAIETLDNPWVPCSERLPEEYDEYLCQDADGDRFVGWLENAEWCRQHVVKENIVAWMPLPEPYNGGAK